MSDPKGVFFSPHFLHRELREKRSRRARIGEGLERKQEVKIERLT
jgi:hypothetical protein